MTIKRFGKDTIYVCFPLVPVAGSTRVPRISPEVSEWLRDKGIEDWAGVSQLAGPGMQPLGVFLSGEDAVAFRLRFKL
jgi:hypothetical protein